MWNLLPREKGAAVTSALILSTHKAGVVVIPAVKSGTQQRNEKGEGLSALAIGVKPYTFCTLFE